MNLEEYRKWAKKAADWSVAYRKNIAKQPVRSQAMPGDTLAKLPAEPPEEAEDFSEVFADFTRIVPPGLTNWQHPRFFAYFPANASLPSVLAEQLAAAMGINSMLWQTSPVATEMEIRMLEWLAKLCAIPNGWRGVIQDTASSANFTACVTMRERALNWQGNLEGLHNQPRVRIYYGEHSHSSVLKGVWLSGIGKQNALAIGLDETGSMDAKSLSEAIENDRRAGFLPAGVMATLGATSTGCSDNLDSLGDVLNQHNLYGHVDGAWAGSAMICEEHRHLMAGIEKWDSYVFNPHKWLGTNFDLSAQFLKDPEPQIKTMATTPSYLRTGHAQNVDDFSTWVMPLGRRFRALKLWFVIRAYGAHGLRSMIRDHVKWASSAADKLAQAPGFALWGKPNLGLVLFRHELPRMDGKERDEHNAALLERINSDGHVYLTPTLLPEGYALRMSIGTTATTQKDVEGSIERIIELAAMRG